jgi:hypothetical protein
MKITEGQIRQIVREELEGISPQTAPVKSAAMQAAEKHIRALADLYGIIQQEHHVPPGMADMMDKLRFIYKSGQMKGLSGEIGDLGPIYMAIAAAAAGVDDLRLKDADPF